MEDKEGLSPVLSQPCTRSQPTAVEHVLRDTRTRCDGTRSRSRRRSLRRLPVATINTQEEPRSWTSRDEDANHRRSRSHANRRSLSPVHRQSQNEARVGRELYTPSQPTAVEHMSRCRERGAPSNERRRRDGTRSRSRRRRLRTPPSSPFNTQLERQPRSRVRHDDDTRSHRRSRSHVSRRSRRPVRRQSRNETRGSRRVSSRSRSRLRRHTGSKTERHRSRSTGSSEVSSCQVRYRRSRHTRSHSRSRNGSHRSRRSRSTQRRSHSRHATRRSRKEVRLPPRPQNKDNFSELVAALKSLGQNNSMDKLGNMHNTVPEFDPSKKEQTMTMWLHKVNECATIYGWTEKQLIHFSLPKLRGVAQRWYEGLSSVLFSWQEWQAKLLAAFPSEENYGQMLSDMLAKRARYGEPLEDFYYDKLALISRCGISGKRAVECIIYEIDDRSVRLGAEAVQFDSPDKLLAYLRNTRNIKPSQSEHRKINNRASTSITQDAKPGSRPLLCFNCKQDGHMSSQCTQPLKKCGKCGRLGHETEQCYSNFKHTSSTTGTGANDK